ncbi:MAG: hypothetical protein M0R73_13865 [Dehalococcoidia bacterium]|nr:hypothetical protein [Dehalococcoidia bacterium]
MARARTKAQREPTPQAEETRRKPHVTPAADHALATSLARASGMPSQQAARVQTAGNAAVRRSLAERVTRAPASGPQRLWDRAEFGKRTYESFFTQKSQAQKTVEQLITAYAALQPDPKGMPTAAHANLLAQMRASAEFWINDHTATDEDGSVVDPNRPKRMQGFRDFLTNVDAELALVKTGLGDKFSPEIGEKHEAFTALAERYTGSASTLFTKAAGLVDRVVGNPGESGKVEIEFEIPVDPSGVGFIGGRLTVEASREDDMMVKTRTEMVVTGGAKVGIAKIKAELGGFVEAQAPSAAEVMNLYSYGMYRRFRESSVIPAEMTNYLWGGSRGDFGKKKAENWSRDLEKRLFEIVPLPDQNEPKYQSISNPAKRKEAYDADLAAAEAAQERVRSVYVTTGGVVAGKGEVGLSGIAELAIGVKYTSGKKIDADAIVAAKGAAGAKNKNKTAGFGQQALGKDVSSISGSIGLTLGPIEGQLTVGATGEKRTVEFEVGGKVPASAMNGLPAYLADVAVSGVKLYRTLQTADSKTESLGPLMAFGSFQKSLVGTPVHGAITRQGLGVIGDVGLKFVASMEREDGKWTGDLELKHVTELGTDIGGALKVTLEKESRLAKWSYGPGGWTMS